MLMLNHFKSGIDTKDGVCSLRDRVQPDFTYYGCHVCVQVSEILSIHVFPLCVYVCMCVDTHKCSPTCIETWRRTISPLMAQQTSPRNKVCRPSPAKRNRQYIRTVDLFLVESRSKPFYNHSLSPVTETVIKCIK